MTRRAGADKADQGLDRIADGIERLGTGLENGLGAVGTGLRTGLSHIGMGLSLMGLFIAMKPLVKAAAEHFFGKKGDRPQQMQPRAGTKLCQHLMTQTRKHDEALAVDW